MVAAGAGGALVGVDMGGIAGAGIVLAGMAVPTAWLAVGASRARQRADAEQASRRRVAGMAAAQDARIQVLRRRVREIDQAQTAATDQLRTATAGLMATRVQLAALRGELDSTRGELADARRAMASMQDQLTAALAAARPVRTETDDDVVDLVLPGAGPLPADPTRRLILPPELSVTDAAVFVADDRAAVESFQEDDDLTGILSVSDVLRECRVRGDEQRHLEATVPAEGVGRPVTGSDATPAADADTPAAREAAAGGDIHSDAA